MSNRRKSFRGGKSIDDFEDVEFELNDESFRCKPAIQGAVLLEFVAKADGDSGGAAASALYGFFKDCMPDAEYERFTEYLNRDDLIIDMSLIGDIAAWLVEEYTARPTRPSGNSEPGQSTSGPQSTERPSSAA